MPLSIAAIVTPGFMENCYLVADEESGEALVVDPGGELDRIERGLADRQLRPTAIVLTHGHIDHVGVAAQAQRRLGVPLLAHADEREWLEALPVQAAMFGLPEVEIPKVDRCLADGEELPLGRQRARVIHTPGHSPGGICLFFPEARVLLTGDTLFARSIGRTDLPGGNLPALLRSIRERLFPLGDDVAFYPGHGPNGTLGEERRSNPFAGEAA